MNGELFLTIWKSGDYKVWREGDALYARNDPDWKAEFNLDALIKLNRPHPAAPETALDALAAAELAALRAEHRALGKTYSIPNGKCGCEVCEAYRLVEAVTAPASVAAREG